MNFNFDGQEGLDNEYLLMRDTTHEMIQLYGILIKYVITSKINQDTLYGEHSHIKVDNESVHNLYVRPADTSMFEGDSDIFSKFGMQNLDTMSIYISREDMERIHPEIVHKTGKASVNNLPNGNLVILGSGKIMEVTDFKLHGDDFGNSNVFTSDREKNAYKLSLKSYIFNHDDLASSSNITDSKTFDYEDFGNLESIFGAQGKDEANENNIEHEATEVLLEDEVIYPNTRRDNKIREKEAEKNPFGDFG